MLQPNNPDIDFDTLERLVSKTAAVCRRDVGLTEPGPRPEPTQAGVPACGWRQRVRAWPIIGGVLSRVYWGLMKSREPGLSLPQRVRALPGMGEVAAWLHAAATLPAWRRELREELARTRTELAQTHAELVALRMAQGALLRDLAALRVDRAGRASPKTGSDRSYATDATRRR